MPLQGGEIIGIYYSYYCFIMTVVIAPFTFTALLFFNRETYEKESGSGNGLPGSGGRGRPGGRMASVWPRRNSDEYAGADCGRVLRVRLYPAGQHHGGRIERRLRCD